MTKHLVKADDVLAMVEECYREDGIPPSVRMVMDAFNLQSSAAAWYWLQRLVKEGRLRQVRGKYIPTDLVA